jgi:hypothetical protein
MSKEKYRRGSGTVSPQCPKCGGPSSVIVTTRNGEGVVIRLRRCRETPGHIFQTHEIVTPLEDASQQASPQRRQRAGAAAR